MKNVILLIIIMLFAISVNGTEPEDIIENTIDYMKTQFIFGIGGDSVGEIDYLLSGVFEYEEEVVLIYNINDHNNPNFKTRVGFVVNEEENIIEAVLFDKNYLVMRAKI